VFAENKAVVDFELWPAGIAHRQNSSAFAGSAEAERVGGANVIHDNIYPALLRQAETVLDQSSSCDRSMRWSAPRLSAKASFSWDDPTT
jgi:hypothetical protein